MTRTTRRHPPVPTYPRGRWDRERLAGYGRTGLHNDAVAGALLGPLTAARATETALVDDDGEVWTWARVHERVDAVAGLLLAHGVRPGHVALLYAPNRAALVVAALATWRVGAVLLPVVDIYAEAELGQLLDRVAPRVVVSVPASRDRRPAELLDDLLSARGQRPAVRLLVDGERAGWTSIADASGSAASVPVVPVSPDDPCLLLLTSGSTGRAKIAVHCSRSLLAEGRQVAQAWEWAMGDLSYVAVPMSHISGLLRGILLPVMAGSAAVLRSRWDTERSISDLARTRASYTTVPGLLLSEFIEAYENAGCPELGLKLISVGVSDGAYAAVQAADGYGMSPSRAYGLSELPTATIATRHHGTRERIYTCGPIAPGVEMRILDPLGTELAAGTPGEVVVRGPEQMLGYLDEEDDESGWTTGGWLRTGDLGVLEDGCLRLVGRVKDIINRGGEKFSAAEIEDTIRAHPAVSRVAVVPGPDPRLGEVPVAFVVLAPGAAAGAAELAGHMAGAGVARQKVPSVWRFVPDLPMTGSGKIRKGELAERSRAPGFMEAAGDEREGGSGASAADA